MCSSGFGFIALHHLPDRGRSHTHTHAGRVYYLFIYCSCVFSGFGRMAAAEQQKKRDVFKLSHDRLSVQEVVDAVSSTSCGAISIFLGSNFNIPFHNKNYNNNDINDNNNYNYYTNNKYVPCKFLFKKCLVRNILEIKKL